MSPRTDYAEVLAKLRAKMPQGSTLQQLAKETGLSVDAVFKLAREHEIARRRRSLEKQLRQKVERDIRQAKHSGREIARRRGVGLATVCRMRAKLLKATEDVKGPFTTRRLRSPRRCQGCGAKLSEWPCIACGNRDLSKRGGRPDGCNHAGRP